MTNKAVLVGAWVGAVAACGWFIAATLAAAYAAEEQLREMRWTAWQSASLALALVLVATAALLTVRAVRRTTPRPGRTATT